MSLDAFDLQANKKGMPVVDMPFGFPVAGDAGTGTGETFTWWGRALWS
jgi:hypothetical protein